MAWSCGSLWGLRLARGTQSPGLHYFGAGAFLPGCGRCLMEKRVLPRATWTRGPVLQVRGLPLSACLGEGRVSYRKF